MADLLALRVWCYAHLTNAMVRTYALHGIEHWSGPPPKTVQEFLDKVPRSARALQYHVLCHGVAYATYAHMRPQRGDETLYAFMHDQRALESRYTLMYMLAMRGLGSYIYRIYLDEVRTICDLYDIYVGGWYPMLMSDLDVCEGTETHDSFASLAETLLRLFSCYTTSDVELV